MRNISWWEIGFAGVFVSIAITVATISLVWSNRDPLAPAMDCDASNPDDKCNFHLAESLPFMLNLQPIGVDGDELTHDAWTDLVNSAKSNIRIAALYWDLTSGDPYPTLNGQWGPEFYAQLQAAKKRNVDIRVVQSIPTEMFPDTDSANLAKEGTIQLRSLNMTSVTSGRGGVLHTKFITVDDHAFYLGSANLDWKSLALVKELGVVFSDCRCLTQQVNKVFDTYWIAGDLQHAPDEWPNSVTTSVNLQHKARIKISDFEGNNPQYGDMLFSISPPPLTPPFWTSDIDGLLSVMNNATVYIHAEVMDYSPTSIYGKSSTYWPVIDTAMKQAVLERGVDVRFLCAHWNHTYPSMLDYLSGLQAFGDACKLEKSCRGSLEVRLFTFPNYPLPPGVDFVMVNHAKFMVTEQNAFVGTSNWTEDYFTDTGGVSFISNHQVVQRDVRMVFDRDWDSPFAKPLTEFLRTHRPPPPPLE